VVRLKGQTASKSSLPPPPSSRHAPLNAVSARTAAAALTFPSSIPSPVVRPCLFLLVPALVNPATHTANLVHALVDFLSFSAVPRPP
jgi:hypothetical protein